MLTPKVPNYWQQTKDYPSMDTTTSSPFDPETFLSQPITAPMAVEWSLVNEGTWLFHIDDIEVKGLDGNDNTIILNLICTSQDPILDEIMGRKLEKRKFSMFISIEGKTIATGRDKNIELGKLREALGQNSDNSWTLRSLVGNLVKITIKHFKSKNSDRMNERLVNFENAYTS